MLFHGDHFSCPCSPVGKRGVGRMGSEPSETKHATSRGSDTPSALGAALPGVCRHRNGQRRGCFRVRSPSPQRARRRCSVEMGLMPRSLSSGGRASLEGMNMNPMLTGSPSLSSALPLFLETRHLDFCHARPKDRGDGHRMTAGDPGGGVDAGVQNHIPLPITGL